MTSAAARTGSGEWGRRRLLVTLVCVGLAAALLVVGLGYAVYFAIGSATGPVAAAQPATKTAKVDGGPAQGKVHRDQVAAAPMLAVTPDDARGGTPAPTPAPTIAIPAATRLGPVQVPTGYPKSPSGAIGQLAAIETTVLQAMSIPQAGAVYDAWAMPGGAGAAHWELTGDVQAFLGQNSGGQDSVGQAKAITTTVTATPAAGQVKGADGDDWVVACVLLDVHAVITTDARIGYGYCERMAWTGGRWMIAPGTPPAHAPSTWPGTDLATRAGWRAWNQQGQGVSRP